MLPLFGGHAHQFGSAGTENRQHTRHGDALTLRSKCSRRFEGVDEPVADGQGRIHHQQRLEVFWRWHRQGEAEVPFQSLHTSVMALRSSARIYAMGVVAIGNEFVGPIKANDGRRYCTAGRISPQTMSTIPWYCVGVS